MAHLKCRYIVFICVFYVLFFLSGCSDPPSEQVSKIPPALMKVHYIDVGQGDSILVQIGSKSLLIDAGSNEVQKSLTAYIKQQGIKTLDYVIATHPHEDHIGSMDNVINKFEIKNFYAPRLVSATSAFESVIKALHYKKLKIHAVKAGDKMRIDENTTCEFLAPNSIRYENLNNYSIVTKITHGDTVFLFMGDAEELSEQEILSRGYDVHCDVLKVGHHGSTSSSSSQFLAQASPKIAVISCGKGNEYGHPHPETITKYNQIACIVLRTDKKGTIIVTSDGKNIKEGSGN